MNCARCGSVEYQPSVYPFCNTCFKDLRKQGLLQHVTELQRPQDNNIAGHTGSEEGPVCETRELGVQDVPDVCGQLDMFAR